MPYITQEDRNKVLETGIATNVGELNFLITLELHNYVKENGLRYQHISDINKVLEQVKKVQFHIGNGESLDRLVANLYEIYYSIYSNKTSQLKDDDFIVTIQLAQLEFYRTVVAPYENQKALENGHISELDKDFFISNTSFFGRKLEPGSTRKDDSTNVDDWLERIR